MQTFYIKPTATKPTTTKHNKYNKILSKSVINNMNNYWQQAKNFNISEKNKKHYKNHSKTTKITEKYIRKYKKKRQTDRQTFITIQKEQT